MSAPASPATTRLLFAAMTLVLAVQVLPRLTSDSVVLDEEWDLSNAVYYWKDLDVTRRDGPLPLTGSLIGLPALALPVRADLPPRDVSVEVRSHFFLYYMNLPRLESLVASGRLMSLLFAIGIAWFLLLLARGRPASFLAAAAALAALDPLVAAYSGVGKNDMAAAFFSLAAWVAYHRLRAPDRPVWDSGWAGILAGMALLTKPTALFLLPSFVLMEAFEGFRARPRRWGRAFGRLAAVGTGFAAWVFLAYLPTAWAHPGTDPIRLFLDYAAWMRRHADIGTAPYFLGGFHAKAAFLALPVSLFFKWTIPFTVLVLAGMFLGVRRRIEWPSWTWVPLVGMALTLVPAMGSKICRHLLPVYPFLILTAAGAVQWGWERTRGRRGGRIALLFLAFGWPFLTAAVNFPHVLSYMNDLVPRKRKAFFLNSYSWDLNQDVKRLAETGRVRGWTRVKLANTGRVDPHFHGLEWDPWTRADLEAPRPGEVYVVNAGIFTVHDSYLGEAAVLKTGWPARRTPTGWVSDTWMYFEMPGDRTPDTSATVNTFPYFRLDKIPYRNKAASP